MTKHYPQMESTLRSAKLPQVVQSSTALKTLPVALEVPGAKWSKCFVLGMGPLVVPWFPWFLDHSKGAKKCCQWAAFSAATAESPSGPSFRGVEASSHEFPQCSFFSLNFDDSVDCSTVTWSVHQFHHSSPIPALYLTVQVGSSASAALIITSSFSSLQGWWYTTSVYSDAGGEQKSQSAGPGCIWGHWFGVLEEISILRSWWWTETTWTHQHWVKYRDIHHPLGGKSLLQSKWHFVRKSGAWWNITISPDKREVIRTSPFPYRFYGMYDHVIVEDEHFQGRTARRHRSKSGRGGEAPWLKQSVCTGCSCRFWQWNMFSYFSI